MQLTTDANIDATDQTNEAEAYAQLQADMDTETAFAAAHDVAEQAYTTSEQAYTADQATSVQVQTQGDAAQATAIAGVVFAATPQPIMAATATGAALTSPTQSPLTVNTNVTAAAAINLTSGAGQIRDGEWHDLTVNSGVTIQSTARPFRSLRETTWTLRPARRSRQLPRPRSRSPPTATTIRVART